MEETEDLGGESMVTVRDSERTRMNQKSPENSAWLWQQLLQLFRTIQREVLPFPSGQLVQPGKTHFPMDTQSHLTSPNPHKRN